MTQRKFVFRAALALVLLYALLALLFLDRVPTVHEDEPWIASTSWSLATRGVFGSPMFKGMEHMDERYYEFMPLYPMIQAVLFWSAGVGLFQARFVSVAAGALTLSLTFAVGRRLFTPAIGMLAMGLLLAARTGRGSDFLPTGILFLDVNRLARYDALVPLLGLSALLFFLTAHAREKQSLYFASGILAGLAALAHLYGVFWGAALLLLALQGRQKISSLRAIVLGLMLPWLFYALYVLTGWEAWYAQQQHWNATRFLLLNPAWYAQNVLNETTRYAFLELGMTPWGRTGAQIVFTSWIATGVILIWRAWRLGDLAAQVLGVTTACLVGGLALLVNSKVPNYVLTLAPIVALTCAWGMMRVWSLAVRKQYRSVLRASLIVLVFLVLLDSLPHLVQLYVKAAAVTPYKQIADALRGDIVPGTRVMGLHSTWFAFSDMEYRDVIAIFDRAQQLRAQRNPLGESLSEFDPGVIVIDPRLRAYFEHATDDSRPAQIKAWMQAQHFQCVWSVGESTHGYYEIYRRVSDTGYRVWDKTCPIHLNRF
jgi:4-amino-4-deoxy-L-arabinose transferase-like glycosyltransferase